jgi:hypothetical protein
MLLIKNNPGSTPNTNANGNATASPQLIGTFSSKRSPT